MEASALAQSKAQLLGKGPFDIEQFAGPLRFYLPNSRTISSLAIAFWDLIGKTTDQPLYKIPGPQKDRVPATPA